MRLRESRTLPLTYNLRHALLDGPDSWGVRGRFSERQLRAAWEEHGERVQRRADRPGQRPWAFWRFEAGREEHPTECPLDGDPEDEHGRRIDAWEFDPILYLARHGHLRDDEVERIRSEARAAAPRVGTDAEQFQNEAISKDRSAVRLARAVDRALVGDQDDDDHGVPYSGMPQITYERRRR
jgi:hypothetical protein